ncbi:DUF4340 domain-containing protein [Alienimonas californiensis]|uniref:DUF4340 domain-containing protein n=1 Tax=Alienimonas californiensis TaxID=2527989 RepID=A0A517PFS8_9PLAN|nr:DUF4340 domain-containing protein [Alienimonas californiensis]QDT18204.1 hypothetical protein CA12_43450 [Alienimonas californiensis]
MTETARTAAFAAVAAVAVAFAAILSWPGPTPETAGFEQVGTPFFTAFETNAGDSAGNLSKIGRFTITAFDADTGAIQDFRIRRDEETGLYGIAPYDYPAEAAEQLAEIASALGSVERTALQSRRASDWADLGVVDPASEDVAQLEGRGLRIEVLGDDGNTLADLIVGKAVEGRDGYFYVREPRDDSTYIVQLANLDLSASFVDWIDPKALEDVEPAELRRITVPDETVDPQSGELVSGDPLVLSRDGSAGDWTAADPPAGKSVDQAKVNQIASAASGLMIVGVRPKPAGLKPDLTLDPAVVRSQAQYQAIVRDVTGKGFSILPTADGGGQVLGEAGQLTVSTAEGVAYDLDFGELFTGNSYDFAVGDAGEGYKTLEAKPDAAAAEGDAGEGDAGEEEAEEDARGRYLFVTARVDAAALGEPPVEPQAPAEESETDEQPADEPPAEDAEASEGEAEGEPDAAQAQYEQDLAAYRTEKAAYDRKLAAAAERVEELNRRYGDWYYVVDAADVAELSLRPAALLTDAPPALPADGAAGEAPPPGSSPIEAPGNLQDLINGLSPGMGEGSPAPGSEPAADPAAEATGEEPAMTGDAAEAPNPPAPAEAAPAPLPKPTAPADAESGNAGAENPDAARSPVTAPRPDRPTAPQAEPPPGNPKDTPDSADGASEAEQAGESGSPEDADDADSPAEGGTDGDE